MLALFCTPLWAGAGEEECHDPNALKQELAHETAVALQSAPIPQKKGPPRVFDSREKIIQGILALKEAGLKLNSGNLQRDEGKVYRHALKKAFGADVGAITLLRTAEKEYGSWNAALLAAGLNPNEINLHSAKKLLSDPEQIIKAIRLLKEAELSLNSNSVRDDEGGLYSQVLSKAFNAKMITSALQNAAKQKFGSWDKALLAAGFDPVEIRARVPVGALSSKEQIIKGIQALRDANLPLNQLSLNQKKNSAYSKVLGKAIGAKANPAAFAEAASKLFGSWDAALTAAGIDPSTVRRHAPQGIFATKEQIIKGILALREAGLALNATSLDAGGDNKLYVEALSKALGTKAGPQNLTERAREIFGSWDAALLAAGLQPNEIHLRAPDGLFSTPEQIIKGIQALRKAKLDLRYTSIRNNSGNKYSQTLLQEFNVKANAETLYSSSQAVFGSWDEALRAAGIDPQEVRVKAALGARVFVSAYDNLELRANARGEQKTRGPTGQDTKNPEQLFAERQNEVLIQKATSQLAPRDRATGTKILEVILEADGIDNATQLIDAVTAETQSSIPKSEIQRIIGELTKTPALKELLER